MQQYGKAHSGGNDRNSKIKIVQVNNQLVVMGARDSKQQRRWRHSVWALANAATVGENNNQPVATATMSACRSGGGFSIGTAQRAMATTVTANRNT